MLWRFPVLLFGGPASPCQRSVAKQKRAPRPSVETTPRNLLRTVTHAKPS